MKTGERLFLSSSLKIVKINYIHSYIKIHWILFKHLIWYNLPYFLEPLHVQYIHCFRKCCNWSPMRELTGDHGPLVRGPGTARGWCRPQAGDQGIKAGSRRPRSLGPCPLHRGDTRTCHEQGERGRGLGGFEWHFTWHLSDYNRQRDNLKV